MAETTAPPGRIPAAQTAAPVPRIWIALFLLATAQPLTFSLLGLHMNAYRLVLLLIILPLGFAWVARRAPGGIMLPDLMIIGHVIWAMFSFLANNELGRIAGFWASLALEAVGPYLLARLAIRSREDFLYFARWVSFIILGLLPFAAIEAVTGRTILMDLYELLPATDVLPTVNYGQRLGMTRAQVTFEHPILYGVYCGSMLAMALVVLRIDPPFAGIGRFVVAGGVALAAFLSLSAGALSAMVTQLGLLSWDWMFRTIKARWKIFAGLFGVGYVIVDLLSNRTPITILISYITFSSSTAWNRVLIWRYGTDEVWRHPFLGIGLNDWERPSWMSSSVDNFWLLLAMRYGLPGFLLFAGAVILIARGVVRRDFSADPALRACQLGYMLSLAGTSIALGTVAFWGASYATFVFFVASGVWMIHTPADGTSAAPDPGAQVAAKRSRYTRFSDTTPSGRPRVSAEREGPGRRSRRSGREKKS